MIKNYAFERLNHIKLIIKLIYDSVYSKARNNS